MNFIFYLVPNTVLISTDLDCEFYDFVNKLQRKV